MLDWLRKRRPPASAVADPPEAGAEPWAMPYDPAASEEDIFRCFRLLLGRHPNPEEWQGHSARRGEDLAGVVASYLKSLECSRRGLLGQNHLDAIELADFGDFRLYVPRGDVAHRRDSPCGPGLIALLRRYLQPGMGVVDLGAGIGYVAMLSAVLAGDDGWVVAVEPNPACAKLLEASRRANGFAQVTVCQVAAGRRSGLLALSMSHANATTSDLPDDPHAVLDAATVPCVRADSLMPPGRRVDLVRADLDGAGHDALLGCSELIARWRPLIVSRFAPSSGADDLHALASLGYELRLVQTDGSLSPVVSADALIGRGTDRLDLAATPAT